MLSLILTAGFLVATISPASAINNGTVATSAPNVVSIIKEHANGNRYGICSGALIAPRIVITAAHCVTEDTGLLAKNVWVSPPGARWKQHTEDGKQWSILESASSVAESRAIYERNRATSIQITSTYYSSSDIVEDNDVAFLVLAEALPVTTNIVLASDEETENFISNRSTVRIYGYGQTRFDEGQSLLPMTTTMSLDYKSTRVKNSAYLTSSSSDACPGDSGGPVIVTTPQKLYLIGIISGGLRAETGPECSRRDSYGRYSTLITLVTKYANLAFAAALTAEASAVSAQKAAEAAVETVKATLNKTESDAKASADSAKSAADAAKAAKDAADAEVARLGSQVTELNGQITSLSTSLEAAKAEMLSVRSELASLKKKLTTICKARPKPRGC